MWYCTRCAGPLGCAADRGSLLSPLLLTTAGQSCMSVPGDYSTCAGFPEAIAAATAAAVAEGSPPDGPLYLQAAAKGSPCAGATVRAFPGRLSVLSVP